MSVYLQKHCCNSIRAYLQILKVLCETAVAVRTKAMKCLSAVVEADPGIVTPESTLSASVEAYEKQLILKVLEKNQWHRGKAAAELGVHRRTLFKKIKKYQIDNA